MKHLGDITKIDWSEVEPVDVVTGGSPCQDLSVAGKRAGLAGERSGLYMEQIRCVKELREADVRRGRTGQFIRPRYMVWENVPGAFSSGKPKGADFAAVIEEIIKAAEPDAAVRVLPPRDGWSKSGCYYDSDGRWSIAWRVHDAQFWGVPQRRKRIALVADFGGLSAPEVLFERKGLSGHFESCGAEREETAGSFGVGAGGASGINCRAMAIDGDVVSTITTEGRTAGGSNPLVASFSAGQGEKAGGIGWQEECSPSLKAGESGTNRVPAILPFDTTQITSPQNGNKPEYGDPCHPLAAGAHAPAIAIGNGQLNQISMGEQANTLDTMHDQQCVMVAHSLKAKANCDFREDSETYPITNNTVRRLTPLECERLQGYPDGWTDIGEWVDSKGRKHKEADSPRYKALGNSIALPFWKVLAKRISAQYDRDVTMGSLFDGIGGFPLVFEQVNGKGTARWASEIEEFPMAVTKLRFGED